MTNELAHQANAWAEEERRQSQIIAEAIDKAIHETGRQFETPILNAVAGALVTATAGVLASVDSPNTARNCARQWTVHCRSPLPTRLPMARASPKRLSLGAPANE